MFGSSKIRRFINGLAENTLFNNRELLAYAPRALIDTVLSSLCKKKVIIREARGVYRRACIKDYKPSLEEVIQFKAKAFGRKIVHDFLDSAHALGLTENGNEQTTFITDGATTSFMTTSGIRIHLKNKCARKVELDDGYVGQAIKALWFHGNPVNPKHLQHVFQSFNREQAKAFRESARLMPGWMADAVAFLQRFRPSKKEQQRKRSAQDQANKYHAIKHLLIQSPFDQHPEQTDDYRSSEGKESSLDIPADSAAPQDEQQLF